VRWWGGTLAVLATGGRWAVGGVRGAKNTDRWRKPQGRDWSLKMAGA
jgi:hypothetical protein